MIGEPEFDALVVVLALSDYFFDILYSNIVDSHPAFASEPRMGGIVWLVSQATL